MPDLGGVASTKESDSQREVVAETGVVRGVGADEAFLESSLLFAIGGAIGYDTNICSIGSVPHA